MVGSRSQSSRVECLEERCLLTGFPLDLTFGSGGQVANISGPMKVLPGGKIVVDLNDSGTIERLNTDVLTGASVV